MISASQLAAAECRRQDLLADAARFRLAAQAPRTRPASPAPTRTPVRPLRLVRAYARFALSALASVAFGLSQN
jgi:hypothetical protein